MWPAVCQRCSRYSQAMGWGCSRSACARRPRLLLSRTCRVCSTGGPALRHTNGHAAEPLPAARHAVPGSQHHGGCHAGHDSAWGTRIGQARPGGAAAAGGRTRAGLTSSAIQQPVGTEYLQPYKPSSRRAVQLATNEHGLVYPSQTCIHMSGSATAAMYAALRTHLS